MKRESNGFSSSIGFVLAAAGSAVGVGNIWRFPYLAAKDGGGLFILIYLILVFTFGFTLLTTDIAIGRKTQKNPIEAFKQMHPKWGFLGKMTFFVPALIMTFYTVIGGWVLKYITTYLTFNGASAAGNDYFNNFISSLFPPIIYTVIFILLTAIIVYMGVEKGVEGVSKIIMPGLIFIIVVIGIYSLTLTYNDNGVTRTGLEGLAIYLIPNFDGITLGRFFEILLDAMSQIFFSMSVSMGIMITFGSYVKKDVNLSEAVSQIELCDTGVALMAGLMIVPAVYVFMGLDGMKSGPGLMFVSLPKVFLAMGNIGAIVGLIFFVMVAFAALTSCVSIMETLISTCMDMFKTSRQKMCVIITVLSILGSVIICLGYNALFFDIVLPNGAHAQLLDIADYISNSVFMPLISFLTCIFIGWIKKPKWIIEEMESSGHQFSRKSLYVVMIRYIAPIMMFILFLQSTGLVKF